MDCDLRRTRAELRRKNEAIFSARAPDGGERTRDEESQPRSPCAWTSVSPSAPIVSCANRTGEAGGKRSGSRSRSTFRFRNQAARSVGCASFAEKAGNEDRRNLDGPHRCQVHPGVIGQQAVRAQPTSKKRQIKPIEISRIFFAPKQLTSIESDLFMQNKANSG